MSEENKPAVVDSISNDFTQYDLDTIKAYQENGLQGIDSVNEKQIESILEMYLSGKTYRQIALTMRMKKEIVLYLSFKFNWYAIRKDYLTDIENSMRDRVLEARIVNQDFLLQLQAMWQKKIGTKIAKYLSTDNEEFANEIDLKEVDKYLKTVELLQKLAGEGKLPADNNRPLIGVNAGDGVTITRTGENSMEITPKSKAIGDALKMFADSRREEEKKPIK